MATVVDDNRGTAPGPSAAVAAYGATCGHRRFIRVPDVADLAASAESEVVDVYARPGVDKAALNDAIQGLGVPLFLQALHGYEVLHASAVATTHGVVGFCGYSGDGKSTVAHAYADDMKIMWSDDILALRVEEDRAMATALPFRQNLREASRHFFGGPWEERPGPTPWSTARLRALCVLEPLAPQGQRTAPIEVTKLSGGGALAAILPHGLRLLPLTAERERRILTAYLGLVAAVPVYRVEYERRFEVLPPLVRRLEQVLPS